MSERVNAPPIGTHSITVSTPFNEEVNENKFSRVDDLRVVGFRKDKDGRGWRGVVGVCMHTHVLHNCCKEREGKVE